MALTYYFKDERAPNPWPQVPKQSGGAFGSISGRSSAQQQPKKFGGGFGSSISASGFGGSLIVRSSGSAGGGGVEPDPDTSFNLLPSTFKQRKETSGFNVSRGGFGVGGSFGAATSSSLRLLTLEPSSLMNTKSDDRCATPKSTENVVAGNISASRRGGFGSSPRTSEVMSPSKRSRTGRRTGRRGPRGPGHCFHCQEHGHISRECPKKAADTDDIDESGGGAGDGTEADRFVYQVVVNESAPPQPSTPSAQSTLTSPLTTRDAHINAKLENQKQRDSYYAGYGYGKTNTTTAASGGTGIGSLMNSSSITGFGSGDGGRRSSGAVVGVVAVGGGGAGAGGGSIKSPEVDKFSEQLDNALKLHHVGESTPTQSPRGLTQVGKGGGGGSTRITSNKHQQHHETAKSNSLQVRDPIKDISSEMLTIETRRIVMREGECHLEETTIINFPRLLPPNVRVITAQFVPVTSTQGV